MTRMYDARMHGRVVGLSPKLVGGPEKGKKGNELYKHIVSN